MNEKRQPRGIPVGGQFAARDLSESGVRLVTIPASEHIVQTEPLLAENTTIAQVAADGTLTSVVQVEADAWEDARDPDARADLLAAAQWAHSGGYNIEHEIVAYVPDADESAFVIKVTNDISAWVEEGYEVDDYNASVEPGYALTPEKVAFLLAPGFADAKGRRAVKDLDGYDTIWTEDGPMRVTPCCGASATGTGDYIGCRSCYQPVDDAIGMSARIVAQHAPWVAWNTAGLEPDEERRVLDGITAALQAQQKIIAGRVFKPTTWQDQVVVLGEDGLVSTHLDSAWDEKALFLPDGTPDPPNGRVLAKVSHEGRVDTSVARGAMTCLKQRVDGRFEHWGSNQKLERHQCARDAACNLLGTHPGDCVVPSPGQ